MFKVKYEDNHGDDTVYKFNTEEAAVKIILEVMEECYERFLEEYPDKDVTWINRLLDVGDTTEVYVPGTDEYCSMKMLW